MVLHTHHSIIIVVFSNGMKSCQPQNIGYFDIAQKPLYSAHLKRRF